MKCFTVQLKKLDNSLNTAELKAEEGFRAVSRLRKRKKYPSRLSAGGAVLQQERT
jgi:hypothetical protein